MHDESQSKAIVEPDTENKTTFYGNDIEANYEGAHRVDESRQFKDHYDRLSKPNRGLVGK